MGTPVFPTPEYGYSPSPELGGLSVMGGAFLVFIIGYILAVIAFGIVATVFEGIGFMKMYEKLGLKGGWIAFVPILNFYALGKIAEQYVKSNGKKSARFSVILPASQLIAIVVDVALVILSVMLEYVLSTSVVFILISLIYILFYVIAFAALIISYVALWRVFAIFSNKNATLFLLLSIFVSVATPFLIFAIRNNEPECIEKKNTEPIVEDSFATVCND